ncbi:DUF4258 domain-containing protein [Desulfonema magnum]|uniref:DUF4258 n=1 Tax=Desulfonema magnum TaxID=45655 RepID=A0A975GUI3_9BACT|nr:DUF4258 domain-containing protein [Desulfonema magnum]QTA93043.1 DUF4258 [Desulfonema magnum]
MEYTRHFNEMLEERNIRRSWAEETLQNPDRTEDHEDGTRHFIRQISEYGNRWLRVVINVNADPNRAVTAFFDRRLRRKSHENQSR